jgi:hypothetical protein
MDHDALISALKRAYATQCRLRRPLAHGAKEYFTNSFVSASHVLAFLEEQEYATECLIRTRDGEAIARIDDWRLMVTTYQGGAVALLARRIRHSRPFRI